MNLTDEQAADLIDSLSGPLADHLTEVSGNWITMTRNTHGSENMPAFVIAAYMAHIKSAAWLLGAIDAGAKSRLLLVLPQMMKELSDFAEREHKKGGAAFLPEQDTPQ